MVSRDLEKVYTLSENYAELVAKAAGYKSMEEYFLDCDVLPRLKDIKIPTFFLSTLDDPFFGPYCIPMDERHENVLIGVTKYGGHVCHFQGVIIPSQWYTIPAFAYLNYFVEKDSKKCLRRRFESSKCLLRTFGPKQEFKAMAPSPRYMSTKQLGNFSTFLTENLSEKTKKMEKEASFIKEEMELSSTTCD